MVMNMKKYLIYTLLLVAATAVAQDKLPEFANPAPSLERLDVKTSRRMPSEKALSERMHRMMQQPAAAAEAVAETQAEEKQVEFGYANPEGTLFLGMDVDGRGIFFSNISGVIGAWADSIECWRWINKKSGYKKIEYLTGLSNEYPSYCEDAYYSIDEQDNFCDSITAHGGPADFYAMGNDVAGYLWQMAVPLQIVTRQDGSEEKFILNSTSKNPTVDGCGLTVGGLPADKEVTADGLWPMTNALVNTTAGASFELIESKDPDGYVHYLFGSSKLTKDSAIVPASDGTDSMTYTRVAPVKIITRYDRPQGPIYIKSVALSLSADGFDTFTKDKLVVHELTLNIIDKDGNVVATSTATPDNYSALAYKMGRQLTFEFKTVSPYGELLKEGVLLKDAFQIEITGMQEDDAWGIYSSKSLLYDSKSTVEYEDGTERVIGWDPHITLYGIYPTLEDYFAQFDDELNRGAKGDTIPVNMVYTPTANYKYMAHYATEDMAEFSEFRIYSSCAPYDTLTREWNMDIERPAYIQMGADYEYNVGPEDDPISIWDYLRLFFFYIYATETPQYGDEIKIGKWGRELVFQITQIDGVTALENYRRPEAVEVKKVIRDGRVLIERDGKCYDMLGQKQY